MSLVFTERTAFTMTRDKTLSHSRTTPSTDRLVYDNNMYPLIIMTPVGPGSQPYFLETAKSVLHASDSRVSTVPLHWVICGGAGVQWSSITDSLNECEIPITQRITLNEPGEITPTEPLSATLIDLGGVHSSAATGRNMIATYAPAQSWLLNLDADDLLHHERLDEVACTDSDFHLGQAVDLRGDDIIQFPDSSQAGREVGKGWFEESWASGNDCLDVHMTTLSIKRDVLLRVGGYPSSPVCEDSLLAIRLSREGVRGYISRTVVTTYRIHDAQTTARDYDAAAIISSWMNV